MAKNPKKLYINMFLDNKVIGAVKNSVPENYFSWKLKFYWTKRGGGEI